MTWNDVLINLDEILKFTLFRIHETPVTVMNLLIFVLFISGFVLLGIFIRKALHSKILQRFKIDRGTSYTLSRITQYTVFIIGAMISFQFIGIDLSGLAVIFGLLSVGIGFGLQNVTANFISGLIILFERPISVGDRVMVNEIEGDVTEINIRSTTIRTLNNISIIVPNSDFVSKEVVNYSHGEPSYRLDLKVGVSYDSDLDKVINALGEIASDNESIMEKPEPAVYFSEFGESAWEMQLRVWVEEVKEYPQIKNELNQAIVRKFREQDIKIPYPQRDLHLRSTDQATGVA